MHKILLCIIHKRLQPGTLPQKLPTHGDTALYNTRRHKCAKRDPVQRKNRRFEQRSKYILKSNSPMTDRGPETTRISRRSRRVTTIVSLSGIIRNNSFTHQTSSSYKSQASALTHCKTILKMIEKKFSLTQSRTLTPRSGM